MAAEFAPTAAVPKGCRPREGVIRNECFLKREISNQIFRGAFSLSQEGDLASYGFQTLVFS